MGADPLSAQGTGYREVLRGACLICVGSEDHTSAVSVCPFLLHCSPLVFSNDQWPVLNHPGQTPYPILPNLFRSQEQPEGISPLQRSAPMKASPPLTDSRLKLTLPKAVSTMWANNTFLLRQINLFLLCVIISMVSEMMSQIYLYSEVLKPRIQLYGSDHVVCP